MSSLIAMPQGAEWLVILAIVILVFGAAKLPDLARGTGQALRIFKAETKGLKDDDDKVDGPAANEAARPAGELPPTTLSEETSQDSPIVGEPRPDQRS